MAKKKFFGGLAMVLALVFGLVLAGCDDGSSSTDDDKGGGGLKVVLNSGVGSEHMATFEVPHDGSGAIMAKPVVETAYFGWVYKWYKNGTEITEVTGGALYVKGPDAASDSGVVSVANGDKIKVEVNDPNGNFGSGSAETTIRITN